MDCGISGVLGAVLLGYALGVGTPVRRIASKLNGGGKPDRLGQALLLLEALGKRLGDPELPEDENDDTNEGSRSA